jgi:zinc protease
MIYVHQPQLPITYAQLYFSTHLSSSNSSKHRLSGVSPAIRILTQRQLQRGTKRASRSQFTNDIESLGTELQMTHRGYSHSVGAVVLSRTLPQLMALLQEALTSPRFDEDEVEQSKRAYIAELEARYDDDHSLAWLWLSRRLHINHPLWHNYSIERNQVETISIDELKRAWDQVFSPNALLPCFTSDLSKAEISDLVNPLKNALNHSSNQNPWQPIKLPVLPPITDTTLTLIHKPAKQQALLFIAHPTLPPEHPQSLALYVALCALGGTFSSPLMQEVRNKRGLSYGAHAGIRGEAQSRFVCLHTAPDAHQALETLTVMLDVYRQGAQGNLSDIEIEFAKNYLINAHPFSIETAAMRAALIAHAQLMGLNPDWVLKQPDRIRPLSFEDIRQAAREHLSLNHLELLVFGDQEKAMNTLEVDLKKVISIKRVIRAEAIASPNVLYT